MDLQTTSEPLPVSQEVTLIVDLCGRLKGYGGWIETTARIESSDTQRTLARRTKDGQPIYRWQSIEKIAYSDETGNAHIQFFTVTEGSLLQDFKTGQSILICYNPSDPSKFYVRKQLEYKVKRALWIALAVGAVVVLISMGWH